MTRLWSVAFNRHEQLQRATLITELGPVKVEWREVGGDRCWFTIDSAAARQLAVPLIQRIERRVQTP